MTSILRLDGRLMPNRIAGILCISFSIINVLAGGWIALDGSRHGKQQTWEVGMMLSILMGLMVPVGFMVFFDDEVGESMRRDAAAVKKLLSKLSSRIRNQSPKPA